MKHSLYFFLLLIGLLFSCKNEPTNASNYESETLKIVPISTRAYQQISYLPTKEYGNVPCNGLVFTAEKEAIIFDTPTTDSVSIELIDWVEKELKCSIKAVVVNHFHVDCLGGLQAFHDRGIPSYANNMTLALAKADSVIVPMNGFDKELILEIGGQKVVNEYFGAGHTADNIISYIPSENLLFGGCMLKSLTSGKGNLADANIEEWSNSVAAIKQKYPKLKTVIPGHGKFGGVELLDYTVEMFEK